MDKEIKHLQERPIDRLRRHETSIELLEEHAEDASRELKELRDALRELREMYMSDRRMWRIAGKSMQVLGKWGIYVVGACIAWAWSHWDKIEIALGKPPNGSK